VTSTEIVAAGPGPQAGLDDHIYNRLLKERIIFLGSDVRDDNANAICAQMLLLAAEDPKKDIWLYINSPGRVRHRRHGDLRRHAVDPQRRRDGRDGHGRLDGAVPALRRRTGQALRHPHARVMMHQPSGGIGGTASDIKIQAEQLLHIKKQMAELIAQHTGQSVEQIEMDSDRDRWFTAEQAKEYGFVDQVITKATMAGPGSDNPVTA
jgi:ATP-dependent Clp protease protease subunit